jgi:hypothetical protein
MSQAVQVVARTWARDSYDLFDFEANEQSIQTNTFTVTESTKFLQDNGVVQMISEHLPSPPGADPLFLLSRKNGMFVIDSADSAGHAKKLWLVIRDLPSGGHSLAEGDEIKLGRSMFRVRQLATPDVGAQPKLHLNGSSVAECKDPRESADKVCRICLMEGATDEDPLLAPCSCKGSIECVHLKCLQSWTKERLNHGDGGSYVYKSQSCELCKAPLPDYIQVQGERQPLVEVPTTAPPFIVLENAHDAQELHVISLADGKPATIGRGQKTQVRIADVSISRAHATIRFQEGRFLLEDNGSKFGTFVAMKPGKPLDACSTVSIQAGHTVLSLSMQPSPNEQAALAACSPQLGCDEDGFEVHSEAVTSGDGSVENVGIRMEGSFQCQDCRQKFDTQKAKDLHWKFIHDPNRHKEKAD